MVFGMRNKKKGPGKKNASRSMCASKPSTRSHEMDRCRDSARSAARGPRNSGRPVGRDSARTLRGATDGVNSSARSMRASGGAQGRLNKKAESMPPSAHRARDGDTAAIRVTVRFRPLSRKERSKGDTATWGVDENNNVGRRHRGNFSPKYRYDTVFTEDQDNQFVYASVAGDIVETAMGGVNGTIFAYGVTSSGKTHTMMGEPDEAGVVPRTVGQVFELIEQNPEKEYLLRLSMLEIYNEELNDLLDPRRRNLKVREDRTRGVHVDGLTEVVIETAEHALCLIQDGIRNRQVSATTYNEGSSRSHTLCRISIEVNDKSEKGGGRAFSYLNLIDLAGSESARAAKSKGHRVEGSFINKSLLTLGTVIHKLSEAKKKSHIPFRDSKLTRLLQSSLTGSGSKMAIICCVTPSSSQAEETENTLKFAERAKKVKIKRTKNEMMDSKSEIAQLHRVIADLKKQLKEMSEKAAAQSPPTAIPDTELQEELSKARERLEEELHARMKREQDRLALEAKIERLTRFILQSTRAQTGNMLPKARMHRSHSFDALKAKSAMESFHRDYSQTVVVRPEFPQAVQREVSEMESFSLTNQSINPGNQPDNESQSENEFLRKQLSIVRSCVAEREKELSIRKKESSELKRRLACFEGSNPSTSRSYASDDDLNTQSLELSLLEADRGVLEESLIVAKKDKERLTAELLHARIELKRSKKKLQEYETAAPSQQPSSEQLFRAVSTEHMPPSPTGSISTTETGVSDGNASPRKSSDEKPPRHPQNQVPLAGAMMDHVTASPTELRAKLSKLEAEVRCALQALSAKDSQIESQRRELVSQKEEAQEVKQLLQNLGSENEGLKQRIKMLEAQQNRMQGYLLDTMPTSDLYALRAEIKDASHRLERAAYSRRISSIPALSFDELDTDSTQDIYVSKALESAED